MRVGFSGYVLPTEGYKMPQQVRFFESFKNGLLPDAKIPRNMQYLLELDNLRATEYGIKACEAVSAFVADAVLTSASVTKAHPFPQTFRGKGVTLLCTATKIYSVNEGTGAITLLTTYDLHTPTSTKAITSGGPWQFVDFHTNWMLFNGACVVFKLGWVDAAKVFVQNTVTVLSGADYRGRLMMGGFNSANFWSSAWGTLWETMIDQATDWGFALRAPSNNWVYWSAPGGGDFMMLFLSTLATANVASVTGGHDADDPLFLDFARRVSSGFMPMDWQGDIMNLAPMEDFVLVCGEDGISGVIAYPEPVPTFGLKNLLIPTGLASRNSIGGTIRRKVLVDAEGNLWSISSAMQTNRLGYKDYFVGMLGDHISVNFDPVQEEFWIGNNEEQFVLSSTGLGRAPRIVNSLHRVGGGLAGISVAHASPTVPLVETIEHDFGTRAIKTITRLELSGFDTPGVTFRVYWRVSKSAAFTLATVAADGYGVGHCRISGIEFRFGITAANATNLTIDDLIVTLDDEAKVDMRALLA